jgi:hypothetical protein
LSNQPETLSANRLPEELFELRLQKAAKALIYPATPHMSGAVITRSVAPRPRVVRMGWVIAGILLALLLAAGLAAPTVRAAVLDWIRIGAVRIYLVQPSPTPIPTRIPARIPGAAKPVITLTPLPSPNALSSVLDLSGETTLSDADSKVGF